MRHNPPFFGMLDIFRTDTKYCVAYITAAKQQMKIAGTRLLRKSSGNFHPLPHLNSISDARYRKTAAVKMKQLWNFP